MAHWLQTALQDIRLICMCFGSFWLSYFETDTHFGRTLWLKANFCHFHQKRKQCWLLFVRKMGENLNFPLIMFLKSCWGCCWKGFFQCIECVNLPILILRLIISFKPCPKSDHAVLKNRLTRVKFNKILLQQFQKHISPGWKQPDLDPV